MTLQESDTGGKSDQSCRIVLAQFAPFVLPEQISPLSTPAGFSGANIWRVHTAQGDFALRRWPRPGIETPRILELHRFLKYLHSEGLDEIAVPLVTPHGTSLPGFGGNDWQLEPWMPGTADFQDQPTTERLRSAMIVLERWHAAAARYSATSMGEQWFGCRSGVPPNVLERLELLNRADDAIIHQLSLRIRSTADPTFREAGHRILQLFQSQRIRIRDELRSVCQTEVHLHPCLRDVWHDHVLFRGDTVSGLIDPSAARTDNVASDLSRLIGSLIGDNKKLWTLALDEYEKQRPLSSAERRLVTVLDRSGVLLSGWTWLQWLFVEGRRFTDTRHVVQRLSGIQKRMGNLSDHAARSGWIPS